jgi:alanine racemase
MINNNPVIENAAEYLNHPYSGIKANAYGHGAEWKWKSAADLSGFSSANCRKKCLLH